MLTEDDIAQLMARPADALDALDRVDCEESLLQFVRRHWSVLEPANPMVQGWPIEALCEHLQAVTDGHIQKIAINVPPGFSKAVEHSEPVLTTWGWRRHGDLAVGDFVFAPNGRPVRIIATSDDMVKDAYRITFDDRTTMVVGGEHLWLVERDVMSVAPRYTRGKKTMIVPTTELRARGERRGKVDIRPDRIAVAMPIELPPQHLMIDPYVLGAWLGDGFSNGGNIGVAEEDKHQIGALGVVGTTYEAGSAGRKQNFYRIRIDGLHAKLKVMGLLKNKHIPAQYLAGSLDQRWQLLQGLMDTDGCAAKNGHCSFSNKNKTLIDGVFELVCSLGLKASITQHRAKFAGRDYGIHYLVSFNPEPTDPVFRLTRKQDRLKASQNTRSKYRSVVAIENIGPAGMKCIQVEGSLYLVGKQLLCTHNSLITNVYWPAWEWGPRNMPHLRYVTFSYSSSLTQRDNRRFRDVMLSHDYGRLFGDRFALMKTGEELVSNDKTGWKLATSISGVGTGERGDRVINDDLNNVKDSESDPIRNETNRWIREGMSNRLNDAAKSAVISIQQRTHELDATGTILSEMPDFHHLKIPMEWDGIKTISTVPNMTWNQDPRTVEGELAWAARFSEVVCQNLKTTVGPHAWAGQYQQIPTPRGGGIFKRDWWQVWDPPLDSEGRQRLPACEFVLASFDGAFGQKQENDYSALTVWGVFRNAPGVLESSTRQPRHYLEQTMSPNQGGPGAQQLVRKFTVAPRLIMMNAWRKRLPLNGMEVPRQDDETEAQWRQRSMKDWGIVQWVADTCRRFRVNTLLIESKANGIDVANEMRRQYSGEGWGIRMSDPGHLDKVARAYSVQHILADRMVYAPDRDWADDVISECAVFPKSAHDDYVDSTTMAWKFLRDIGLAVHGHELERDLAEQMQYKPTALPPLYPT